VSHVTDLLVENIATILDTALKAGLGTDDAMYPNVVRPGLLQENPVANMVSITVHLGDPDESSLPWVDETADRNDPYIPFTPMFEIGGDTAGMYWWRRGVVKGDLYWLKNKLDRDVAREYSNVIRGKIEKTLMTRSSSLLGLTDEQNERVIAFVPAKSSARESGGPSQHIWRVKVWWQALTAR
jgi:hypothetical protein